MNAYPTMQERLDSALCALNCMTDQRDQLAAQLKDATAQLSRAGDLLRSVKPVIEGDVPFHATETALHNIDGYLNGEVLPPKAPE